MGGFSGLRDFLRHHPGHSSPCGTYPLPGTPPVGSFRGSSTYVTLRLPGPFATATTGPGATVTLAAPAWPSTVAEILTTPGATPVPIPAFETVDRDRLLVFHVIGRPGTTLPPMSRGLPDHLVCDNGPEFTSEALDI